MTDIAIDALLEAVRGLAELLDDVSAIQGFKLSGTIRKDIHEIQAKLDALIAQRKGKD